MNRSREAPSGDQAPTVKTVMIVLEEPFVRELIAASLRVAGCFPLAVKTVAEGKRLAALVVPDVIVIDLDDLSPDDAAWATSMTRAAQARAVRTAMLSSRVAEACGQNVAACGAHVCISKPFEPRDLIAKLLRLVQPPRVSPVRRPRLQQPLRMKSIELEREEPTVRLLKPEGWVALELAWTEHRLLEFLLSDPMRVRSREAIRDAVWPDSTVDVRTVDQCVRTPHPSTTSPAVVGSSAF